MPFDPKTLKAPFLFFIAGLIAGVTLAFSAGIIEIAQKALRQYASIRLGEMLDMDFVYLSNGDILKGRILSEKNSSLHIEFEKGSGTFEKEEINRVEKDFYTRYARALW